MKITYYQGDTIPFKIEGDSFFNLTDNDFKVLFYNATNLEHVIEKSDLTADGVNAYTGDIPNTITKNLKAGIYIEEVVYGDDETKILQGECFELLKSRGKSHVGN